MKTIIRNYRLGLFLGLAMFGATALMASIEVTNLMTSALNYRNKGNLKKATELLVSASNRAKDPKHKKMAMFMLGDCYLEEERYSDAVKVYARILNFNPTVDEKSEAFFCLIKSHSFLGNDNMVAAIYKRVLSEAPRGAYASITRSYYEKITSGKVEAPKKAVSNVAAKNTVKPVASKKVAKTVSKSVVKKTVEAKAAKPKATKPRATAQKSKPQGRKVAPKQADKSTVDSKSAEILKEILAVRTPTDSQKEQLVSKILVLQDQISRLGEGSLGVDELLFELANNTFEFGEHLEACKTYDKILHEHQTSKYVERAYYEAIRIRAILGLHDAVVAWSNAFLNGFPSSVYTAKMKALREYSGSGGKLVIAKSSGNVPLSLQITDKSAMLKDKKYIDATNKMKNGDYDEALRGFMALTKTYGEIPELWWDVALVNVQMEDFKAASVAINKMLRLDPGNEDANSLSGYIHYRLEDYETAASAYENTNEPSGRGVNFYDGKGAAEKMKNSANATQ